MGVFFFKHVLSQPTVWPSTCWCGGAITQPANPLLVLRFALVCKSTTFMMNEAFAFDMELGALDATRRPPNNNDIFRMKGKLRFNQTFASQVSLLSLQMSRAFVVTNPHAKSTSERNSTMYDVSQLAPTRSTLNRHSAEAPFGFY